MKMKKAVKTMLVILILMLIAFIGVILAKFTEIQTKKNEDENEARNNITDKLIIINNKQVLKDYGIDKKTPNEKNSE